MRKPERWRAPAPTVILVAWLIGVAFLTLRPAGPLDPLTLNDFLCLWCSSRPGADKILNLLLFVPGGVALGALVGVRAAIGIGLVMTVGIETAQALIPGRHPTVSDVVLNGAGVATGAWLYRVGPRPGVLRIFGVLAAVGWVAPTLLLAPAPREAQLFAIWTPQFSGQPSYSGEILRAEIAGMPLRYTVENSDAVRREITARAPLELGVVAGAEPSVSTLIFGLWDENTDPNLTISADREDVRVWWWSRAATLGLEHPGLRARSLLSGVSPGDTVTLGVEQRDGGWCIVLDGRADCHVSPGLDEGWSLLLDPEDLGGRARHAVSIMWTILLGAIVGVSVSTWPAAVLAGCVVGGTGFLGAHMSPDMTGSITAAGLLALASVLGAMVRPTILRLGVVRQPDEGVDEVVRFRDPPEG